jgi:type III pantothenate kinase
MAPHPPTRLTNLTLDLGNTRDKYALFQGHTLLHAGVAGSEELAGPARAAGSAESAGPGGVAGSAESAGSASVAGSAISPGPGGFGASGAAEKRLDASSLGQILAQFQPTHALVSNTGPERQDLLEWLGQQLPLLTLNADTALPFANAYQTPQTLGRDRIALAAGALHRAPDQAVLAIDAGTCITLEFVDSEGVYQGGIIAPGIRMRLQAMHTFTARLPLVDWKGPGETAPLVGKSTRDCMLAGALTATAAEMDGLADRYRQENPGLLLLLTGGDASALAASMKNRIFAVPHLLMEGLNKILIYNVLERI